MASFDKQFPRVKVIGEEGQKVEDFDWLPSDWVVETRSEEVAKIFIPIIQFRVTIATI